VDDNQISVIEPQATVLDAMTVAESDSEMIEAVAKAKKLKGLINEHHWSEMINDSEHIKVEAWITLARWYRCTAEIVDGSVRRLDGYKCAMEARAEVIEHYVNPVTGARERIVVGAAEAECGTEGDGYWEHGQPERAVRSMAQTRAISKAISSVFRWVVVLAGYSGTPREDMPHTPGPSMTGQPAGGPSEKQVKYLRSLGYTGDPSTLSRTEVSRIIDDLKDSSTKASPGRAIDGFWSACANKGWSATQVEEWLGDRSPEEWAETTGNSLRAAWQVCETKSQEEDIN
jgi:hypothetical protein